MKLGKFKGLSSNTVRLINDEPIDKTDWRIGDEIFITIEAETIIVQQGDQVISFKLSQTNEIYELQNELSNIFWSLTSIKKDQFFVRYIRCSSPPIEMSIDIGVSQKVIQHLFDESMISDPNVNDAIDWLNNEFLLIRRELKCLFVFVYSDGNKNTLEICGCEWIASLQEIDGYWKIIRITRERQINSAFNLLQGEIKFVDATIAGQNNDISFKNLKKTGSSYLELWEKYANMEWKKHLNAARELGALRFNKVNKGVNQREWIFYVDENMGKIFNEKWNKIVSEEKSVITDSSLEVMLDLPDWLENDCDIGQTGLTVTEKKPWLCNIVSMNKNQLTLRIDKEKDRKPETKGFICMSMHGYRKVRERRFKAFEMIKTTSNAMPQLYSLLEGICPFSDIPKKIKPLSPAVKKIFYNKPTEKQIEALDVALNTPDIAIIIGPPGTGKTQVISAIEKRLTEEYKQNFKSLISSFQHDAVDHALSKINCFGLPPVKVGGKRYNDFQKNDSVDLWCNKKLHDVSERLNSEIQKKPVFNVLKKINEIMIVLRISKPDIDKRKELLKDIQEGLSTLASKFKLRLPYELDQKWQKWLDAELIDDISETSPKYTKKALMKRIRALRCSEKSFSDDGPEQCMRLLDWIQRDSFSIEKKYNELLEKISKNDSINKKEIDLLNECKNALLDRFIPDYRPKNVQKMLSKDECQLLDDIQTEIERLVNQSRTFGYLSVLNEYHNELKFYPDSFKNAIRQYSLIIGATCQQSFSKYMNNAFEIENYHNHSFPYVIIDEAARANPLDLLIPMSLGKKIILVGDHRQLPHILEPEVEKKMDEEITLSEKQKEMLQISLFQRTKRYMEIIEKKPKQPRRIVMLDKQFRMHSVLGQFVSEQFYEKYRLKPVKPGFDTNEPFKHNIPGYEGKVCAWIDINKRNGKHKRFKNSFIREPEADRIAKESRKILDSSPDLSLGVITFYHPQVDCIMKAMSKTKLTEKVKDNDYSDKTQYKLTKNVKKRLHIGTVDSFQGKEFDVVLLSLVRTYRPYRVKDENALISIYGFLLLDNRLNVAMSRQHKLLIMVGDIEMAQADIPEIEPIFAFKKLCEGNYGKIC